jgi:hypothetical protein
MWPDLAGKSMLIAYLPEIATPSAHQREDPLLPNPGPGE